MIRRTHTFPSLVAEMATTGVYIDITGFVVVADSAGVKQVVSHVGRFFPFGRTRAFC